MNKNSMIAGNEGEGAELPMEIMSLMQKGTGSVIDYAKTMLETMVGYKELMMMYTCAIKEVRTKFEVLSTEFNTRYRRNPITSIHSRLKSTNSIMEKVSRRNLEFSLETIEREISDIAGIRIICSYVDDIYRLAEALEKQDDITLIEKKDYISTPKQNGYRSLHLIISIPVLFADEKRKMKVEIQIRTIAMDFWASLEHQLKYKQAISEQAQIVARLKSCADVIAKTDLEMLSIRQQLESSADKPSDEDVLLEKLMKLNEPIV